ncbi:Guanosine-3',5'-bis(diphosphate) 3'-pyrophosphohydrolase MESH1 [Chamberlinius hualienensis]
MDSNSEGIRVILKCANFAAVKHKDQRRKDVEQTPYINHPLGVAQILSEEGGVTDIATILAAILHDTVEDTDTNFEEIEKEFGNEVADIVREVTDDKSLPYEERKRLQIVHAPKSSHKAKLVKLGDKLYNLRDLNKSIPKGWSEDRVENYFKWAKEVVDGIRGANEKLEFALDEVFSIREKSKRQIS